MHISKRKGVALLVVAAFAGSAFSASAIAHFNIPIMHHTPVRELLKTDIIGSVPGDGKIHGVTAGGAPWKIAFGRAHLFSNGGVIVAVKGLLITGTGGPLDNTVGPVKTVDAALYCGGDMNTMAAFTTKSVPLSPAGDALIVDKVMLPKRCLTPELLINPNSAPSVFIAGSGFGM